MEQKEYLGLTKFDEMQSVSKTNSSPVEESLPPETIKVVINSQNYQVEIEIY